MTIKGYFYIPVYDVYINITLSDNLKRSINYYLRRDKQEPIHTEPGAYFYTPSSLEPGNYYLFFNINDLKIGDVNHEKSHVIDYILHDCGIKKHDEARAYLDGYVSEKLNKFFTKRKIKVK